MEPNMGYFQGPWTHTTRNETASLIRSLGWAPEKNKNTTYGQAIYLSREPWGTDFLTTKEDVLSKGNTILYCNLSAKTSETQTNFGVKNDQNDFICYLKEKGIPASRTPNNAMSDKNLAIKHFFLTRGIKAVGFKEHDKDIVAVYDPIIIQIINCEK